MAYDNWITGIYNVYDGIFRHFEHEDEINWLREQIGESDLYDDEGNYLFEPKDEYRGYKRKATTDR